MTEILLVDDDPATHKLLSVVLRHQGYEVRIAESAEQAWGELDTHPPDLIISDIHMPGMSGLDFLAKVRADIRFALIPVILLTSLRDRQDIRAGMQLGADDYITKPFRGMEIVEAVRAQIGRQAMRQAAHELRNRSALEQALRDQAQALGDDYEMKLAHALNDSWPNSKSENDEDELDSACVCAFGLANHQPWINALPPQDVARLLRRFHETCGDSGHLFGARLMHFHADGAVAVFASDQELQTAPKADKRDAAAPKMTVGAELRALKAAFALKRSIAGMRDFIRKEWPQAQMPLPSVILAIHTGPVSTARLQGLTGGTNLNIPVGKGLSEALALLPLGIQVPDSVVMTAATMRKVAGAAHIEHRAMVKVQGLGHGNPLDVCWTVPVRQ